MQLHMNTCKLMSQLIAHNYLSCLTVVSREHRRLGFLPLFDNCPPKSRNKERQKKKKSTFSTLYKKDKKLKKLEKILLSAFLRLVRYEYYSRKLVHFISNTNPKNILLFLRKEGTFLRFSKRRVKVKKSVLFFSFECKMHIKSLIFRHFSFL